MCFCDVSDFQHYQNVLSLNNSNAVFRITKDFGVAQPSISRLRSYDEMIKFARCVNIDSFKEKNNHSLETS